MVGRRRRRAAAFCALAASLAFSAERGAAVGALAELVQVAAATAGGLLLLGGDRKLAQRQ